jgi:hypothetical protein
MDWYIEVIIIGIVVGVVSYLLNPAIDAQVLVLQTAIISFAMYAGYKSLRKEPLF